MPSCTQPFCWALLSRSRACSWIPKGPPTQLIPVLDPPHSEDSNSDKPVIFLAMPVSFQCSFGPLPRLCFLRHPGPIMFLFPVLPLSAEPRCSCLPSPTGSRCLWTQGGSSSSSPSLTQERKGKEQSRRRL